MSDYNRYDSSKTLSENIHLTDPILQRFDILLIIQDKVNAVQDENMANFIIDSHINSHKINKENTNVIHSPISPVNILCYLTGFIKEIYFIFKS